MADLDTDDCIRAFIAAARAQAEIDLNNDIAAERASQRVFGRDERVAKLVDARDKALAALDPSNITAQARSNFGPLGIGVRNVVTVQGEPISDPSTDGAFWIWIAGVQAWMAAVNARVDPTDPRF